MCPAGHAYCAFCNPHASTTRVEIENDNLITDENWKELELFFGKVLAKRNSRRQFRRLPVSAEGFGISGHRVRQRRRDLVARGLSLRHCYSVWQLFWREVVKHLEWFYLLGYMLVLN